MHTLHRFARSVVEKSHGSKTLPLRPHVKMIGQDWKELIWQDSRLFAGQPDASTYTYKELERQLHQALVHNTPEWQVLWSAHDSLARFYNAVGFAHAIRMAADAIAENPALIEQDFFIVDEYQDFNRAEELLVQAMINGKAGALFVGDDDQVLYENLKAGDPGLIRAIYGEAAWANAMLPFCSRCGFHITRAAAGFIGQVTAPERISKVFLPLTGAAGASKVQVVLCANPVTAVDYVRQSIRKHKAEIDARNDALRAGKEKDAFLLILSPAGQVKCYGKEADSLRALVAPFKASAPKLSDDYFKVLIYYSAAIHPEDNFTFRKVLHYQGVAPTKVVTMIQAAKSCNYALSEVPEAEIATACGIAAQVRSIIDSADTIPTKVAALALAIEVNDAKALQSDIETRPIGHAAQVAESPRSKVPKRCTRLEMFGALRLPEP